MSDNNLNAKTLLRYGAIKSRKDYETISGFLTNLYVDYNDKLYFISKFNGEVIELHVVELEENGIKL